MAAELCHTDLSFMDGTLQGVLGFTPIIPGHEVAGVVTVIGGAVDNVSVGDRVTISAMGDGKPAGPRSCLAGIPRSSLPALPVPRCRPASVRR